MKKYKILFIFILLTLFPFWVNGQSDIPKCKIAAVARYSSVGAELRWIPDNKTILRLGFDNSYTIERSDSGSSKFDSISTVKAFSQSSWDSLISIEKNPESLSNLQLASDFLFADKNTEKNQISLDKGIAELNAQKSKEDMIYAVFVLTAIKDAKVADALGLGFIDNSVKAGRTYTYRIKLNAKSSIYEIENGEVNVKAVLNPDKYKNEVFVYPGDKKLSFAWSSKPEVSGYFVERAAEGETEFKPLTTTPFYASQGSGFNGPTNGSFMDDSLTNYKTYRYRFYGNTAFGERVMFAEVEGMPRDLTPADNPIIKQPKHVKAKEVLVAWDIYGDLSDLRGFIVARSERDSGDFQVLHNSLLSNKTRSYTDTTFNPNGINYYIVYAIDTAENLSSSYPAYVALVDSTPPAKPQILSAVIDSNGVVTLTVKLGIEKDLKGYRLFKANSPEHEFSVIQEAFKKDKADTNAIKLVYKDTVSLNSLTPKIYYKVKALDF
ncbi:MAG: fibronectin type III domain-containing protein, partial [Ignavibacteriaceae bacterium]